MTSPLVLRPSNAADAASLERLTGTPPRANSRLSHLRATVHSRETVAGETPSAPAASSMVNPAK